MVYNVYKIIFHFLEGGTLYGLINANNRASKR